MSAKERLRKIAERLREKKVGVSVDRKELLKKRLFERKKSAGLRRIELKRKVREKLAKMIEEKRRSSLKEKIAQVKRKILKLKRGGVAGAPMQYAHNLESSRTKNYAIPIRKPAIATKEDLERLKKKQERNVPPVWRGVDLRGQLKVAWLKSLNNSKNEIKAELFDSLVGLGIKEKVAVALIERAFKKGSKMMVKDFVKIAEEVLEMPEDRLKEEEEKVEKEIELNITLQPDGSVEGEYDIAGESERVEEVVDEVAEGEDEEEPERDEELEDRLVKSSVKFPKISSEERDSLLKKALPQYGVLK